MKAERVIFMTRVVAALVFDGDGRFMICQRPVHKTRGLLWEFVGGKVEEGESLQEALVRECREELDVTVLPEKVFMTLTHEYEDLTIELTVFETKITEGEPKKLEHCDIKFIFPSEISQYNFCEADVDVLMEIVRRYA